MTAASLPVIAELTEKLSLETVFVSAGRDDGLLPANSLVAEMEEALARAAGASVPGEIASAVAGLRGLIDRVFEAGGLFAEEHVAALRSRIGWMQSALPAATRGEPLPPGPGESPAAIPAAATVAPSAADAEPLELDLGDAELLREFTNESREHLRNIELGVLTLEDRPADADTLNSIFRAFHTFKGGSGFLNLRPINRLAHELESLLDLARQGRLSINSEIIELILAGGDMLQRFVDAIDERLGGPGAGEPIVIPTAALLASVRDVLARFAGDAAPGAAGAAATKAPREDVASPASVPLAAVVPASATVPEPLKFGATALAVGKAAEPPKTAKDGGPSVKVDTGKLDSLIDLVGEMVIAQSLVAQDGSIRALQDQTLGRNLAQLGRITRDLQRVAMSLRMVPVRGTFQKMNRLVRDVAIKAGKQVELVTAGEETEIDRTITEIIGDPLVHMIRNSLDHGIERPEVRAAAGKPAAGRVWLRAYHAGGAVVIEVEDDGAGLPREKILAKAVDRGLVKPDAKLSESDIFALIFEPGFSTAEKVTDLSGRGVGMDVVRRNIENLRGKILIESQPGKGSKFTIHLPLTLAIIEGLVVGLAGERYILPTLSVRESFRATPDMLFSVQERGEVVNVRGRLIPLLRLDTFFGVRAEARPVEQGIAVVVEADGNARCLLVDQLVGKQEVVIKSLGEAFGSNPNLAGAAILGDGRVGIILDVASIVKPRPSKPAFGHA